MSNSVSVDFDWTPKSVPLSYSVGGNTYPYSTQQDAVSRTSDDRYIAYTTPTNTLLTFTALVTIPFDVTVIEYKWDFGDGNIGYGATATHTYSAAAPQTQATLIVTDSNSRISFNNRILNLRAADVITVAMGVRVS
jgi:hypothetical protein